jgi:hypothetical protein
VVGYAQTEAGRIVADAEAQATDVRGSAGSEFEKELESLRAEAIEEIRTVKDGIERMQAEIQEELETQRILTNVARTKAVAHLVGGPVTEPNAQSANGLIAEIEDEVPVVADDTSEVFAELESVDETEAEAPADTEDMPEVFTDSASVDETEFEVAAETEDSPEVFAELEPDDEIQSDTEQTSGFLAQANSDETDDASEFLAELDSSDASDDALDAFPGLDSEQNFDESAA